MGRPRAAHRFALQLAMVVAIVTVVAAGCASDHDEPRIADVAAPKASGTDRTDEPPAGPLTLLTAGDVGPNFTAVQDSRSVGVSLCGGGFVPAAMLPQAERAETMLRASASSSSSILVSEVVARSTTANASAAIAALRDARRACTEINETRNGARYHEEIDDLVVPPAGEEMVAVSFRQDTGAGSVKISINGEVVSIRRANVLLTISNAVVGDTPLDHELTSRLVSLALDKLGLAG
jgi:hypothetical protein